MLIVNNNFLILGLSKSGKSVGELILRKGGKCYLFDESNNEKILENIKFLESLGAKVITSDDIKQVLSQMDYLIISPGVPINHYVAVMAKDMNIPILGELEFSYQNLKPLTIAVTGTNGKTTTVTMLDNILELAKVSHKTVGNIGVPLSSEISSIKNDDVALIEVSSFQLESVRNFKADVACVLNIAPDHLERHYTMNNYIFLKKRIFKNQTKNDVLIVNYDDEISKSFIDEAVSKVLFISLREKVKGAYRENGNLYFNEEMIMKESELSVMGEHNVFDALMAICVAKLINIDNEIIARALSSFKGVKHRIQLIKESEGIKYINDSKSTNVASTLSALDCMKTPTILILGGSDKGENYVELFKKISSSNVKHVILMGATRFKMYEEAIKCGYSNFSLTSDFAIAVELAKRLAQFGDTVLLSPAHASFDSFGSYEERGDLFIKLVNNDNKL